VVLHDAKKAIAKMNLKTQLLQIVST